MHILFLIFLNNIKTVHLKVRSLIISDILTIKYYKVELNIFTNDLTEFNTINCIGLCTDTINTNNTN